MSLEDTFQNFKIANDIALDTIFGLRVVKYRFRGLTYEQLTLMNTAMFIGFYHGINHMKPRLPLEDSTEPPVSTSNLTSSRERRYREYAWQYEVGRKMRFRNFER